MAAVSLPALPVSPEKGLWLSMPCPIPCKRLITACHRSRCWDSWAEGCGLSMCFCLLEAEDSYWHRLPSQGPETTLSFLLLPYSMFFWKHKS